MRTLFATLALSLTALISNAADDGNPVPYTATVTGVVCGSCKAHVAEALKKLPGVENIQFAKGEKENTQQVTFSSTSATLSKDDAVKALGDQASRYEVLALNKAK